MIHYYLDLQSCMSTLFKLIYKLAFEGRKQCVIRAQRDNLLSHIIFWDFTRMNNIIFTFIIQYNE